MRGEKGVGDGKGEGTEWDRRDGSERWRGERDKGFRANDGERERDRRGGWSPWRVRWDVEECRERCLLLDVDDGGGESGKEKRGECFRVG